MYNNVNIKHGVQVVFTTVSNQKDKDFENDIENQYFKSYRKKTHNEDTIYYEPLKFYMLGDYDICYISLINNFKFSHRLFEPKSQGENKIYNTHSFQSFSGFVINENTEVENIFNNSIESYFIGIINLKLNNGLIIGNGLDFIESVRNYIQKIINVPFILTQTFSWFELSLKILIDNPDKLTQILEELRRVEFGAISNSHLNSSLYHSLLKGNNETIDKTSLFSDTHSYLGFNTKLISEKLDSLYLEKFKSYVLENNISLRTSIEWQIKPGHFNHLKHILQNHKWLKDRFKFDKNFLVLGKNDYSLKEKGHDIMSNLHLIRYIKRPECEIFDHCRKVKTYVYLNCLKNNSSDKIRQTFKWFDHLSKLAIGSDKFNQMDLQLKSLKVSRQVRIKVLKIFSNYNNGIQDPILFSYFLDFKIFIDCLVDLIEEEYNNSQNFFFPIKEIEDKINKNLVVFQEGYNVRFLNSYLFENISDFDLDFNNSIQQLLTSYGIMVHEYGKLFYENGKYGPIIQLNNIDTVSNTLSINYSIHHLTSPEFAFTTILKEILNHLSDQNDEFKTFLNNFKKEISHSITEINESYLDNVFERNQLDLNNFIIDSVRYIITFNFDFKLFEYWFWAYNFQNSSLFNSSGMFNEEQLKMELLRISLIKYYFKIESELECPSNELMTYWDRHAEKIYFITDKLINDINRQSFDNIIGFVCKKYFNSYNLYSDDSFLDLNEEYFENLWMQFNTNSQNFPFLDSLTINYKFKLLSSKRVLQVNPMHDMEADIFSFLKKQYEFNKKRITTLKRNWMDGRTLKNFEDTQEDILYSIDQTGGVYFKDSEKTSRYFVFNAQYLLNIIDFSFKQKLNFINKYLDDKQ